MKPPFGKQRTDYYRATEGVELETLKARIMILCAEVDRLRSAPLAWDVVPVKKSPTDTWGADE